MTVLIFGRNSSLCNVIGARQTSDAAVGTQFLRRRIDRALRPLLATQALIARRASTNVADDWRCYAVA